MKEIRHCLIIKKLGNLIPAPEVILALLPLALRIEGGIKTSLRCGKLGEDKADRLPRSFATNLVAPCLKGIKIRRNKEGLIVEHLFKVGYPPLPVCGITMKSKTNVVVDPACTHLSKGMQSHA